MESSKPQAPPEQPDAPPRLRARTAPQGHAKSTCSRAFTFKGKAIECDSVLGRDGEGLRNYLAEVPEAVAELDHYQANRRNVRYAAWLGTAGIVAALVGSLVNARPFEQVDGNLRIHPGGGLILGGALLTVNSFIYSVSVIRQNEGKLQRAVELHNQARPGSPIELKVGTEFVFELP